MRRSAQRLPALLVALALCGTAPLALAQAPAQPAAGTASVDRPETPTQVAERLSRALSAGNIEPSLRELQQRVTDAPENIQYRFLQARALALAGRRDEARQAYQAMTERFPELPEPHNNLAVLHAQAGAWDLARASLELAVRTDPNYRTAWENLGDVYARQAAEAYARAQSLGGNETALASKLRLSRELVGVGSAR